VISSLVHHVRPDDDLIEKGPKHVVYLLTPNSLIKFCCVLTYPPYINCDIMYKYIQSEDTGVCHGPEGNKLMLRSQVTNGILNICEFTGLKYQSSESHEFL